MRSPYKPGRLREAVATLELALEFEADNEDISKQLTLLKSDLKDDEALNRIEHTASVPQSAQVATSLERSSMVLKELQEFTFRRLLELQRIDQNNSERTQQDLSIILSAMIQHEDALVLLRSTGMLDRLCDWAMGDAESPFQTLRRDVAPILLLATSNKRNTVVLQRRKLFAFVFNKFEKNEADPVDMDYAVAVVRNTFCEDWVLKNITEEFLNGVIHALERDPERAAQILCELSVRKKLRKLVTNLTVESTILDQLLCIVANHAKCLKAAEYSASAIANFSLTTAFQEAASSLAPKIVGVFCSIIGSEANGLSALKADALAALVNTSASKTNEVLDLVAADRRTKNLVSMLDDFVAKKRENVIHTSRGVRLLARCFTNAQFADSIACDASAVRSIFRFVSSVKRDLDLFRPMLAVVAACISKDHGFVNVSLVEPALLEALPKAAGGKDDILCANLLQCFIRLMHDSKRSQSKEYRETVVPFAIEVLRNGQDGPVRKNAAILLAKLAKACPENLKAIRDLRGMEMLVELGSRMKL